jgi:hypothetical protein
VAPALLDSCAKGDDGYMKPGPPRLCDCGACYRCNKRRSHMAYYHRNAAKIKAKNAETEKARIAGERAKAPVSDQELDRRAAEWLASLRA